VPQRVVSFINVVGCGTFPSIGIRQNRRQVTTHGRIPCHHDSLLRRATDPHPVGGHHPGLPADTGRHPHRFSGQGNADPAGIASRPRGHIVVGCPAAAGSGQVVPAAQLIPLA